MKPVWKPIFCLFAIFVLAAACYWPGIHGGFLFDDFHNLDQMGTYGGVHDWSTFYAFVHTGISGPSGRPLSLASFLLDDNTWPSFAPWFKVTNVWVHLLCGLLLCWVNLLILRLLKYQENIAQWMAVFATACWVLHPLLASTTLYVVQRMAQLSTLFMLAGLVGYLKGRLMLPDAPRRAYLWMSLSLAMGTLLAVFSKENGALLPMLVWGLEFALAYRLKESRINRWWLAVFVWLPSVAVLAYLASLIDFSTNPWPQRNFNQPERLMSEARILWDYLRYLVVPQIEGKGLYQDGFDVSRGLLTPWITLPAVLGIIGLVCLGFWSRRKYPLLSLALLTFFIGHLLESTLVGLELYFEHRNYLSAVFLFLPLASALQLLHLKRSREFAPIIGVAILALLAVLLWKRSELWSDTEKLQIYWAESSPNSPRGQNALAGYLARSGRVEEGNAKLREAMARMPDSALLNLAYLLQRTYVNQATPQDFKDTAERARRQPFDAQAVVALRTLVDNVNLSTSPVFYRTEALDLIDTLQANPVYGKLPMFVRLAPYLKGRIYLRAGEVAKACQAYRQSAVLHGGADAILMMVAETASGGADDCALQLLDMAESALNRQKDKDLSRPRQDYVNDIKYLRGVITKDKMLRVHRK